MTDFTITDRLYLVCTYRLMLRHSLFTSPEAVRRANGPRLTDLHIHRAALVRLVRQADPDVMRALFIPRVPIDRIVAGMELDPATWLLSVSRSAGARVHDELEMLPSAPLLAESETVILCLLCSEVTAVQDGDCPTCPLAV